MKSPAITFGYDYGPPVTVKVVGGADLNAIGEIEDGGGGGAPVVVSPPATTVKVEGCDLSFGLALIASLGTISTPDTPDMAITGPIRLTLYVRVDTIAAGEFPTFVTKQGSLREMMVYGHNSGVLNISTTQTDGVSFVDWNLRNGLEYGVDHLYGTEFSPGRATVTALYDDTRTLITPSAIPRPPDTADPVVIGTPQGMTGNIYWAQLEALPAPASLAPQTGSVSTPDTPDMTITGTVRLSYSMRIDSCTPADYPRPITKDNGTASEIASYFSLLGTAPDQYLWQGFNIAGASGTAGLEMSRDMGFGVAHTYGVEWTQGQQAAAVYYDGVRFDRPFDQVTAVLDQATAVKIGGWPSTVTGRIYWMQLERVDASGNVTGLVWRFDAAEVPPGATTYIDPRGRTWTLTSAAAVRPPIAGSVIWRFDADDYPGSGLTYVDPRGRTWTLSAAGSIALAQV